MKIPSKRRNDPALTRAIAAHIREQASIRRAFAGRPPLVRSQGPIAVAAIHPSAFAKWSIHQ